MTLREPALTAEETPAIRRELVAYHRSAHATEMATMIVLAGRQSIRPPGPPQHVGRSIVTTEADRLERADLWHVDADLADLIDAAYPTLPPFAPRAFDLPSRHGFVTFARPLTSMIREPLVADHRLITAMADEDQRAGLPPARVEALRTSLTQIATRDVAIVAASWGPVAESAMRHVAPRMAGGGVWFSFYSMPASIQDPQILERLRANTDPPPRDMRPTLTIDNELLLGWCPDDGDPDRYLIDPATSDGTLPWGVAVLAAFLLGRQPNLAEQEDQPVPRPERRRHVKAGLREPATVRILRLRRQVRDRSPAAEGGSGREYRHRWTVRGHWRNQWYPSIKTHRPKWIAPYIAGPDDMPLIGGDKVTRVSAPEGTTS